MGESMNNSKLSQHEFKKGKFITPLNRIENLKEDSWFKDSVPEYIWIALILRGYGKKRGIEICSKVISFIISNNFRLSSLRMSEILSSSYTQQLETWKYVESLVGSNILAPLTTLYTVSTYPAFSNVFINSGIDYDTRIKALRSTVHDIANHQSYLSTDIRFVILLFFIKTGQMNMPGNIQDLFFQYPTLSHDDEQMRLIRPCIRSSEISIRRISKKDNEFISRFWEDISKMVDCELFYIEYDANHEDSKTTLNKYHQLLEYYSTVFSTTHMFSVKFEVLIGIVTYSYKRFSELVEHELYNEISGRSIVRSLIESYIMLKYLLLHEIDHDNIWDDFKAYGIGQYKLISCRKIEKYEGKDLSSCHVPLDYLPILVNEYKNEEFTNMDTNYFEKKGIREKAIEVAEKELFDLYYDYDSAFEHGLWGAIRESSMLACNESCHRFHTIPDTDNVQKMKSVWHDSVMIMEKIFSVLQSVYGSPLAEKE